MIRPFLKESVLQNMKKRILQVLPLLLLTAALCQYGQTNGFHTSAYQEVMNEKNNIQKSFERAGDVSSLPIDNITLNFVTDPVGVDTNDIFFGWYPGGYQKAYQIRVSTEEKMVWDSGLIESDKNANIPYQGEPLSDLTEYQAEVFLILDIPDSSGELKSASAQGSLSFTTAYMQNAFPDASFIAMQGEENVYGDGQPVFVKDFEIEDLDRIKKAYYLGSALGQYDAYLNGERIGMDEMKPGWTDYRDSLLYNMYDVTNLINGQETNHLAVMLGTGWWCGRNAFGTYDFHHPALIGALEILYQDGSRKTIVTDDSWKYYKDTQIQFADFFNGETVDFRKLSASDFSQGTAALDQEILPGENEVVISQDFAGEFHSFWGYQNQRKNETVDMQSAYLYDGIEDNGSDYGQVSITNQYHGQGDILIPKGQTLIVDLGQNIAGVPEITFSSDLENEITIQFAEMLNDTGEEAKGNDGPQGSLYRKNYRSATTTVSVLTGKNSQQTYSPSFFFTGFRYLSVTAGEDLVLHDIKGIVIGNVSKETGEFTCDNDALNRLYENVKWSQRNNFTLIATDCPQRDERLGWTGDLRGFAATSLYNQDLYSFYEKWARDLVEAQTEDGAYTDTVPATVTTGAGNGGWAEAGILVPFEVYKRYGSISYLENLYPSMQRYMEYLQSVSADIKAKSDSGPIGPGTLYGDWLSGENGDSSFLSALWYALDAKLMSQISDILKKDKEAKEYRKLFANIKKYIDKKYLQNERPIEMLTQTEICFILHYDLTDDEKTKNDLVKRLQEKIDENPNTLMTGFVGTPILLETLTQNGMEKQAYGLLLSEENPSWLYSVNQGATTIWERYDSYTTQNGFADFAMNSFDHFNEGSVAQWMYERLGGIQIDMTGEQPIVIHPVLLKKEERESLKKEVPRSAFAKTHTIWGEVQMDWKMDEEDMLDVDIQIPMGAEALIRLPIEGFEETVVSGGNWHFEGHLSD